MSESYLLATPDVAYYHEDLKLPTIETKRCANSSMFISQSAEDDNDFGYDQERVSKYDIKKRRLHRYMKSEDRFRRDKHITINKNWFNINIKDNQAHLNSPMRKTI